MPRYILLDDWLATRPELSHVNFFFENVRIAIEVGKSGEYQRIVFLENGEAFVPTGDAEKRAVKILDRVIREIWSQVHILYLLEHQTNGKDCPRVL